MSAQISSTALIWRHATCKGLSPLDPHFRKAGNSKYPIQSKIGRNAVHLYFVIFAQSLWPDVQHIDWNCHMNKPAPSLPVVADRRLFTSSPERQAQEHQKAEQLTQYRRTYWQGYKKKIRRVFGTLSLGEFSFWERYAEQHSRTVWGQIYACACAYASGTIVATSDILKAQKDLKSDLQRIGNNLNQAVRLGHIKANKEGKLYAQPDDATGQAVLKHMQELDKQLHQFEVDIPQYFQRKLTKPSS